MYMRFITYIAIVALAATQGMRNPSNTFLNLIMSPLFQSRVSIFFSFLVGNMSMSDVLAIRRTVTRFGPAVACYG
jgi:hypothetical protein